MSAVNVDNGSSIYNLFFDNSIFHALSEKYIEVEKNRNKELSIGKKIKLGIRTAVANFGPKLAVFCLMDTIIRIAQGIFETKGTILDKNNKSKNYAFYDDNESIENKALEYLFVSVIGPLIEELYYREIIQGSLAVVQSLINKHLTDREKNSKYFQWILSEKCRVLIANTFFAFGHLDNAGGYLSNAGAICQSSSIFFRPTHSILYETTNQSLIAPLFSHITNNFLSMVSKNFNFKTIACMGITTHLILREEDKKRVNAPGRKKNVSSINKRSAHAFVATNIGAAVLHGLNVHYFKSPTVSLGTMLLQAFGTYHAGRELMKGIPTGKQLLLWSGQLLVGASVEMIARQIDPERVNQTDFWDMPVFAVTAATATTFLGKMLSNKFLSKSEVLDAEHVDNTVTASEIALEIA